jgi:hypothetical protein
MTMSLLCTVTAGTPEVTLGVVQLIVEGAGVHEEYKVDIVNRRLHLPLLQRLLAAQDLVIDTIDGSLPTTDSHGFTVRQFDKDTLTVTVLKASGECFSRVATATTWCHELAVPWWQPVDRIPMQSC